MRLTFTGALTTALVLATCPAAGGAEFSDAKVAAAIQKGAEFLWSQQNDDGSWDPHAETYKLGSTVLATYALLESGAETQDPRMGKALEFLEGNYTNKTYELGLRCQVWLAAMRHDKRYEQFLREDVRLLVESTRDGSYGYDSHGKGKSAGDNSNSQYGLLGAWAGALGDLNIPQAYWMKVLKHWVNAQSPDGGWGYRGKGNSSSAMVAAGVASLYVCFDNLFHDKFVRCNVSTQFEPIEDGLKWFDENFEKALGGWNRGHSDIYYLLYGIERVGLASGMKYFGEADWYKMGAAWLLDKQNGDGSWKGKWGDVVGTSFAMLFLVRGRHAVLFNKLRYTGDWNNRPRDLASLTYWISRNFETTVNWQVINMKTPVREWHDAPILYIAGSQMPQFSDENIAKLRTFIEQGGTILSVRECGGAGFGKGMREAYKRMFPEYELKAAGRDHPIYDLYFKLGGRLTFWELHNGVRPLAIHTDEDLPLVWQTRNYREDWAFQAAANVFMYVTDKGALRARGAQLWPQEPSVSASRTVKLARVAHGGNDDPEPLAYQRFARMLLANTRTKLEVTELMSPAELVDSGAPVATLTGTGRLQLNDTDKQALKAYVSGGGTLIVDAAGGDRAFAESAQEMIEEIWGGRLRALRRLSMLSSVYQLEVGGNDLRIKEVRYRRATVPRLGRDQAKYPNLRAVMAGTRPAVFFSREDITAGLVGYSSYDVDGYAPGSPEEPGSAYRIMRNLVLFAWKQYQQHGSTEAPTARAG